MEEYKIKLAKIKKSCKLLKIIAVVLLIILTILLSASENVAGPLSLDFSGTGQNAEISLMAHIFREIEKSDSPFSKNVMIRLKLSMAGMVVLTFLSTGLTGTIVSDMIFVAPYRLFEYGYILLTQYDETL